MKKNLEGLLATISSKVKAKAEEKAVRQFKQALFAKEKAIIGYKQALVRDGMSDWAAGIAARVNYRGF